MGQTSFRLPAEMLRALGKMARQRGVAKSQLVREALEQYLSAGAGSERAALTVRERSGPYIGAVELTDRSSLDDVSVRIRRNNWRE